MVFDKHLRNKSCKLKFYLIDFIQPSQFIKSINLYQMMVPLQPTRHNILANPYVNQFNFNIMQYNDDYNIPSHQHEQKF